MKCRRNHPESNIGICSFNQSHHIPGDQIKEHERNCPDAAKFLMSASNSYKSRSPLHSSTGSDYPPQDPETENNNAAEEESWENDLVKSSYDPSKAAEGKAVLRKIEGATPSQRKEFRRREKERHDALQLMRTLEEERYYKAESQSQGRGVLMMKLKIERNKEESVGGSGNRCPVQTLINHATAPQDEQKMRGVLGAQQKSYVVKGRGRVSWKKEMKREH